LEGKEMNFKTGDKVVVIAGKDRGKQGKITSILKQENKVIVEGINMVKKHVKPNGQTAGSIIEREAPVHASNVMIYDAKAKTGTRIGHTVDKKNKKVRVCKKSNETID
jgi:large subunit ribosomal protein L24